MKALETKRLILRDLEESDAADMFEYAKDEAVGPRAGWRAHGSVDETLNILVPMARSGEVWAIEYKANGRMIGTVGLHRDRKRAFMRERAKELGYVLAPDYHGQGIMPEAASAVIKYAFEELGIEVLSVGHFDFNNCSKRVIEKLGFTYEGRIRRGYECPEYGMCDEIVYSMTKEEYFRKKEGKQ